jgi:hypothetical protein
MKLLVIDKARVKFLRERFSVYYIPIYKRESHVRLERDFKTYIKEELHILLGDPLAPYIQYMRLSVLFLMN